LAVDALVKFDELTRQLEELQRAVGSLHGDIGTLRFNPNDDHDVERAIREMERAAEAKDAAYQSNPVVQKFVSGTKQQFSSFCCII
jgi:hypothetical protein